MKKNDMYKEILIERKAVQKELLSQYSEMEESIQVLQIQEADYSEAIEIITLATQVLQQKAGEFLEQVVTLSLNSVFGKNYGFKLEYDVKRGQAECKPWIVKGEAMMEPGYESGGGVLDVVSFGLRMGCWVLTNSEKRTSPVFLLDEPGKFIDKPSQSLFGEVLVEISEMMTVQFVIVSHEDALLDSANRPQDRRFRVNQDNNKISSIESL